MMLIVKGNYHPKGSPTIFHMINRILLNKIPLIRHSADPGTSESRLATLHARQLPLQTPQRTAEAVEQ